MVGIVANKIGLAVSIVHGLNAHADRNAVFRVDSVIRLGVNVEHDAIFYGELKTAVAVDVFPNGAVARCPDRFSINALSLGD